MNGHQNTATSGGDHPPANDRIGKTVAIIDLGDFAGQPSARYGHQPYALRSLGDCPVFHRMARRLSDCMLIDEIFVVGSNVPAHVLTRGVPGVQTCVLPSVHPCERMAAALDQSGADWVAYTPANRPFIDAELVDQLVAAANDATADYVGFASDDENVTRLESLGLTAELIHGDAIRRLRRNSDRLPKVVDRCILSWLGEAPGAYHLKFVPLPTALDRADLRFAIEAEDDWDQTQVLGESVTRPDSQWSDLTSLMAYHPELCESMARRNRRTETAC